MKPPLYHTVYFGATSKDRNDTKIQNQPLDVTSAVNQFKFNKSESRKIGIYSNMSSLFTNGGFSMTKVFKKLDP